jgi:5-formyltetrahydrofolate cyclo-ligase
MIRGKLTMDDWQLKIKDIKQLKDDIRKRILESRGNIAEEEICIKSKAICSRLSVLREFEQAQLIMCYMDFRNEVMTGDLIIECLGKGKRVALPYVKSIDGMRGELQAFEITDIRNDVLKGTYGIFQPDPEKTKKLENEEIDLMVIPGVAFDIHKRRVGYGAGYYDGFLRRVKPGCIKVGLAFNMQIVDNVPAEEHDIDMDIIITETLIL